MAHQKIDEKFDTEIEAQDFVDAWKARKHPGMDLYISGPHFMEHAKVFAGMPWVQGNDYWSVSVEVFT